MAYCEIKDITNDFKSLLVAKTGTVITSDYLDQVIEEESDFIDGYVGQRYVVPVVEADSKKGFNLLKRICVFRVSERVRNKLEVKFNATQAQSDEKFKDNKVRTPNDDLMEIVKGNLLLIDVPLKSNERGIKSFTSSSNGTCAKFDVNKQQW